MSEYEFDYRDQQKVAEPEKEKDPKVMEIVDYPDPVLRATAEALTEESFKGKAGKDLKKLVTRMFATVEHYDGIGLAAPQVGHSSQLFVTNIPPTETEIAEAMEAEEKRWEVEEVDVSDEETKAELLQKVLESKLEEGRKVFINPEILESDGQSTERERCLSIPNISATVTRPDRVKIRALDATGDPFEMEAEGMLARCLQHEYDHLQGKLITDYSVGMEKTLNEPKLKRLERDFKRQEAKADRKKKKRKVKTH